MDTKPVALITGANRGLGRAVAEGLAERQYHVIIGSRNEAQAKEIESQILGRGWSASSVQLDLNSDESIHKAVSMIMKKHGKLDVLINNAAILLEYEGVSEVSTRAAMLATFHTNVFGPAVLTSACIPLLRKTGAPRVVFVSSRKGSIANTLDKNWEYYGCSWPAYKASKAALNMLAANYTQELDGCGGMVNVVCPGTVSTQMVNFDPYGQSPESAAGKVIEMATIEKGGPTGTWTDHSGTVRW
ncbi:hypothetical protein COCSADRAFT_35949 [Bipolaris sorokiniana ND90Pr]|uniref:Uncharacterized protein n=1 Tax=Cochliobolus sativus (strain ND90Pr / ATCC 201652) TaxID=665912 RepID=M2SFJ2_COCSN|nr:uncharacterized protein COCSADRAFT_35949 [Bipolaris sorokiniana ND90Pr]EMD66018.1 hypothetical protein COCSADRAFT_35949 [Bipolaris sorokiniana ND90Pr]